MPPSQVDDEAGVLSAGRPTSFPILVDGLIDSLPAALGTYLDSWYCLWCLPWPCSQPMGQGCRGQSPLTGGVVSER